jgi:hypothetical protein
MRAMDQSAFEYDDKNVGQNTLELTDDSKDKPFTSKKEKNTILIVDASNFYHSVSSLLGDNKFPRIDYEKVASEISKHLGVDCESVEKHYVGRQSYKSNKNLYATLSKKGYKVYAPNNDLEPGEDWDDKEIKKILSNVPSAINRVILASGDKGYIPELEKLKQKNIEIAIVGSIRNTANNLFNIGTFISIGDIIDEIISGVAGARLPSEKTISIEITISGTLTPKQLPEFIENLNTALDKSFLGRDVDMGMVVTKRK